MDLCSFSRWQPEVCDGKKTTEIGLDNLIFGKIFFKGVETRNYHEKPTTLMFGGYNSYLEGFKTIIFVHGFGVQG